jgi:hypothetical protein
MPKILVNQLPDEPFLTYADFVRHIKQFSTFEFLCVCNRFANFLDERRRPVLQDVPMIPRYQVARGSRIYLEQAVLSFLAKESILHASDHRHGKLTKDVMLCLFYLSAVMNESRLEPGVLGGPGLVLRMYEQNRYQTNVSRLIPRAHLLLVEGNRLISPEKKLMDLDEIWTSMTGLTLEKFMMIGFGYFSGTLAHTRVHRNFPARGILESIISQDDCAKVLTRIGATYEEFKELSQEFRVEDALFVKSEFNVLVKRPAILRGSEVLLPIPRLLLQRITDGLFFDISDSLDKKGSQSLHDYFGHLFEQYVGRLLKWAFGEDQVFAEQSYRAEKRRRIEGPDWVVVDGDTALLFECRSRRTSLDSRVYGKQETLADDMKKLLVDTVRKFPGKLEDLRAGRNPIDLTGVAKFEKIVVVYDRVAWEDMVFRLEVRTQLSKAGLPADEDYHIIDIEDLENLTAWNADHRMKDIFAARMANFEPGQDLADFINEYAVANSLSMRHPWLDSVLDDFFDRFGISRDEMRRKAEDDTLQGFEVG